MQHISYFSRPFVFWKFYKHTFLSLSMSLIKMLDGTRLRTESCVITLGETSFNHLDVLSSCSDKTWFSSHLAYISPIGKQINHEKLSESFFFFSEIYIILWPSSLGHSIRYHLILFYYLLLEVAPPYFKSEWGELCFHTDSLPMLIPSIIPYVFRSLEFIQFCNYWAPAVYHVLC